MCRHAHGLYTAYERSHADSSTLHTIRTQTGCSYSSYSSFERDHIFIGTRTCVAPTISTDRTRPSCRIRPLCRSCLVIFSTFFPQNTHFPPKLHQDTLHTNRGPLHQKERKKVCNPPLRSVQIGEQFVEWRWTWYMVLRGVVRCFDDDDDLYW